MLLILLGICVPEVSRAESWMEIGIDDRYMMVSPGHTFIQQYFGLTAALGWEMIHAAPAGWPHLSVSGILESGILSDATGICRWTVRAIEQDYRNRESGIQTPPPSITPSLFFSPPLYIPLRPRIEAGMTLLPGWTLHAGLEAALVLLWYVPDRPTLRFDAGISLGTHFTLGKTLGFGLRARVVRFGDRDIWPGFGVTIYSRFSMPPPVD